MNKWHIFFISGVVWAWKSTVMKALSNDSIKNLKFVPSVKDRKPRPWEKDFIMVSTQKFKEMIKAWEFLEYNFVHNQNYYGTRKKDIFENGIEKWKNIIKEIDMLILPKLLEIIKDDRENFTFIFLDLPENEIKNRMLSRWEEIWNKNYENRLNSSKKERKLSHLSDYIIDATKSPEEVKEEIKKIIEWFTNI